MPITQDQMLTLIEAGEYLMNSLKTLAAIGKNMRDYETPAMADRFYKRTTFLDPQTKAYLETEMINIANEIEKFTEQVDQQLYRTVDAYTVIQRWRTHYNMRYRANLSTRRWQSTRKGRAPTPDTDVGYDDNRPNEDIEEQLKLNQLIEADERRMLENMVWNEAELLALNYSPEELDVWRAKYEAIHGEGSTRQPQPTPEPTQPRNLFAKKKTKPAA